MLDYPDYKKLDGVAAAEGIRNKDFTSAELTEASISRSIEINPSINAIVFENFEQALERARELDEQPALFEKSRVAGLPFLIKDLTEVKDLGTSYGSRLFENYISSRHSNIVARYVEAGLPIIGKTNTPEFGLTLTTESAANGPCRNPWNLDYSTGGSSGGAVAAVAAGIVPVAHASDGGGSIRIPASCCGLFGLKPSRGLTAIENTPAESWEGMSVGHVVSRTVRDSAAFLDVIKLHSPHLYPSPGSPDSFFDALAKHRSDGKKLRIAVQYEHPTGETIDEECLLAVKQAARLCESLGHHIEEAAHPVDHAITGKAMSRLINTFTYRSIARRAEALQLDLEDCPLEASTLAMATRGAAVSAIDYLQARDTLLAAGRQMRDFHQQYDVIIQPVLNKVPAKLGWLDMNSEDLATYGGRFKSYSGIAALANGTGQPSMSVPMTTSTENLPVGAMFTAAWGNDAVLLGLAAALEVEAPWTGLAQDAS